MGLCETVVEVAPGTEAAPKSEEGSETAASYPIVTVGVAV